jgi:hypothetical protein
VHAGLLPASPRSVGHGFRQPVTTALSRLLGKFDTIQASGQKTGSGEAKGLKWDLAGGTWPFAAVRAAMHINFCACALTITLFLSLLPSARNCLARHQK